MDDTPTVDELLDHAEAMLDEGEPRVALELCDRALALEPDHPGAHFVRGDALRMVGDLERARDAWRRAALGQPDHADSWSALALASFELLDIAEARRAVARALQEDPRHAEAWWVRSLLAEWRGDLAAADRAASHAHWLDPRAFPAPPRLSDADVEALVEEVLTAFHPDLRESLANVAIVVEELPSEDLLRSFDPPASPLGLLGSFEGPSVLDRSVEDPWSAIPPVIKLYRRNLQRLAHDRAELIDELRTTLLHEIGHYVGLDEDDLGDRGLD